MTGALGSNHDDIDMLGRSDRLEVDRKAVTEEQRVAGMKIRRNVLLIDLRDGEVRHSDKDHICELDGLSCIINLEPLLLGNGAALALGVKTNDDLDSALFEIEGVGVSLGAKADNGAGFILEELQIGIFVGVDFSGHVWVGSVVFKAEWERLFCASKGDFARACQLGDAERIHEGEKFVDLVFRSRDLDSETL